MRGLAPFRYRDFTLYWIGLSVSQIGDWMEATTTAWLLYEITRSPVLLGLGGGIRALSTIAFGLIGGTVADRVPRRRLLFMTQSGYALASLAMGILVLTNAIQFWHFYVFGALVGAFGAFDAPARRSLVPTLVPREDVQSAIAINGSIFRLARLIGPVLAGALLAGPGAAVSYFVNFASYAAIFVALAAMRIVETPLRRGASLLSETVDGARYTLAQPLLRSLLILESVHSLFGLNTALLTIVASDVLRSGPEGLGFLLSARAAGGLAGTVTLVAVADIRRKGQALIASGVAYAGALALVPFATGTLVAALVVAAVGYIDTFWGTLRQTVFQLTAAKAYQGRTMGVLLLAGRGSTQAAQFETGIAVETGGPGGAAVFGALVIVASLIAVNLRTANVRRFRGIPVPPAEIAPAAETDAVGD